MRQPECSMFDASKAMMEQDVEDIYRYLTLSDQGHFTGCRQQNELTTDEQTLPGCLSQLEFDESVSFSDDVDNEAKLVSGPECLDILQAGSATLVDPVLDQMLLSALNQIPNDGKITSRVVADDVMYPTASGSGRNIVRSRDCSSCTCHGDSHSNDSQQDWSRDGNETHKPSFRSGESSDVNDGGSRKSHDRGKRKRSSEDEIEKEIKRRAKTLPKSVPLTEEQRERLERRKRQNREAATRCRQKKRVSENNMIEEEKQLAVENSKLEKEIGQLQSQLIKMRTILSNHHCVMANKHH